MKIIYENDKKIRLDKFLSSNSSLTRNKVAQYINLGQVKVNGIVVNKAANIIKYKDEIVINESKFQNRNFSLPTENELKIKYEDDDLLVISKDHGIVVHPSQNTNSATLVDILLNLYPTLKEVGEPSRPGIVHRIDKETSGLLVVAKNNNILISLKDQFKKREVLKEYLAIVDGNTKEKGIINAPMGRHPKDRKKRALISTGKEAITRYEKIINENGLSLLKVEIQTGRTHQIRVHLSSIGHPIYGDKVYSKKYKSVSSRMLLHSYRLKFKHPIKNKFIDIKDDIPKEFTMEFNNIEKVL
ncbi:MAG: RluA family pseudouridine synthase [Chloroflexota bacterium]|nr:RluA family pseudouridine synthase [Chloroflexota bacterium]